MISFKFGKGGGAFLWIVGFYQVHAIGHDIHEFPFKYIEQRFSKDGISWQEIHKQSTKVTPLQIPGINDFTLVTFCLTLSLKKAEELH